MTGVLTFDTDPEAEATRAAFEDPQVGDRFHELYSFWVYVVHVEGEHVATVEASPPCDLPTDGKLRHFPSREAFRAAYRYETNPRYWVHLAGRGKQVRGWYEALLPKFPIVAPEPAPRVYDERLVAALGRLEAQRFSGDGLGFLSASEQRRRATGLIDALEAAGYVVERAESGGPE